MTTDDLLPTGTQPDGKPMTYEQGLRFGRRPNAYVEETSNTSPANIDAVTGRPVTASIPVLVGTHPVDEDDGSR